MPFMPFAILSMWLLALSSLAILVGGTYIIYQWTQGAVIATAILLLAFAMLTVTVFGRFIVLLFRRATRDEPNWKDGTESVCVERPDGTTLYVETSGPPSGASVVLVHGWGVDNRAFFYTKRALSSKFRVIAWDLRGLGKSSRAGGSDYSLEAMADDLAAVVDLASSPTVIVGHSIGGMIAQTFARRHAHRLRSDVASLVLVGTTYTDPTRTTIGSLIVHALERPILTPLMYLTIALSPLVWALNWLSYFNGSQLIATALTGFAGKESRGQLDFASRFFVRARPSVLARGMLAMFKFDETSSIGNISVPVLLVPGDRDIVVLPRASAYMAGVIPDATLTELVSAKHMGFMERHGEFNDRLLSVINAAAVRSEAG